MRTGKRLRRVCRASIALFCVGVTLMSVAGHSQISAVSQIASQPELISVTPAILHLDLATDQPTATLTYDNQSDQNLTLFLSAQNFTELEVGYKPSFFQGKDAENYRYGLATWMSLSTDTLTLGPRKSGTVILSVKKEELTPGAHYGTVIAQIGQKNGNEAVKVQREIASLIFVRTNTGKEIESATLEAFSPDRQFLEFPKSFLMRINNTGNTEITPYGTVEVFDMFGHRVAKGIINDGSLTTLPETLRRYDIPTIAPAFLLPGKYRAELVMHFGANPQFVRKKLTFYSQGSIPLIPASVLLCSAVALFVLLMRKRAKSSKIQGHAETTVEPVHRHTRSPKA